MPNGTYTTYSYDVRDRVTSITHQPFSRTISYTYDNAGNRLTMTDDTGTTNYSYDNIYQLIQVSYPDGRIVNYTYDPAGNRVSDGTRTYTYNSLNQLVSSSDGIGYNYDGNGNLIQKNNSGEITNYQWNGFDKMVKVILPDNSEIGFIYGADGLRRKNITSSGATNYLLDGLSVLAEYDDSGDILTSYIPMVSMTKDGSTYYYHYDAFGNVRFITDSNAQIVQEYSYDAWGNLTSATGSLNQPYQYVGEQGYYTEPSLNLQLLGQRWYDSEVGRFISRDPIGEEGGLNLYGYVRNNPMNYTDQTGTSSNDNVQTGIFSPCIDPRQPTEQERREIKYALERIKNMDIDCVRKGIHKLNEIWGEESWSIYICKNMVPPKARGAWREKRSTIFIHEKSFQKVLPSFV